MAIKDVLRGEFIGLFTEISNAKNKNYIGLKGTIIDETKNTFVLSVNKKRRTVFKKGCVFIIMLPNKKIVKISGEKIIGKPEDRIKAKR